MNHSQEQRVGVHDGLYDEPNSKRRQFGFAHQPSCTMCPCSKCIARETLRMPASASVAFLGLGSWNRGRASRAARVVLHARTPSESPSPSSATAAASIFDAHRTYVVTRPAPAGKNVTFQAVGWAICSTGVPAPDSCASTEETPKATIGMLDGGYESNIERTVNRKTPSTPTESSISLCEATRAFGCRGSPKWVYRLRASQGCVFSKWAQHAGGLSWGQSCGRP